MLLDILPFGQFLEIEPNIMEATIFEGVEMDRHRIDLVFAGLTERYGQERYAILSNRVNRYSHTHESMQALAGLANLAGFAILVYSSISTVAAGIHELYQDNAKVFYSRTAALAWLRQSLLPLEVTSTSELRREKTAVF
ncbi:MAG: hypothetical protein HGA96_15440 [Desulfobulbaceae bacterium]|nr:hypothetical protein [Desulfobulbaceae bacterium]